MWAASGSCQTLNSAAAVTFPPEAEPPISIIRSSFLAVSGKVDIKSAMFVSGPIGTRVTLSLEPSTRSLISSIACRLSKDLELPELESPASPSPPWTWLASPRSPAVPMSGSLAPAATGMLEAPAISNT